MRIVRNFCHMLTIALFSVIAPAIAAGRSATNPDLVQFRQVCTTGSGLAYVGIKEEKGDKIYKDTRDYMLFTCNLPHVFMAHNPPDKSELRKASVVKVGDPEFAELDIKYLTDCKNLLVKSALPWKK